MTDREMMIEIGILQDEVRKLCDSEENKRRKLYWTDTDISDDYWHGLPSGNKCNPFVVELEREMYSKFIGFSFQEFYTNPYCYYLNSLKIMVFKFKNFIDCTPIGKTIAYYAGAGFEKSIFGGEQIYSERDAWMARESIISDRVDVESLKYPDFYKSGSMPFSHNFYNKLLEAAGPDFHIVFPQWSRSSWGVAWHLRGIESLLVDIMDDPVWVVKFLDYITKTRENWAMQRAEFLGKKLNACNIYNDEVTSPMVSPKIYKEIILPTEIELSNFFGGVNYWHSCGNTTPFFGLINKIPNLHMVSISPWSDFQQADIIYNKDKILEVALFSYLDVLNPPTPSHIQDKLKMIKESTAEHKTAVHANGIQILGDLNEGLKKVKEWINIADRVLLS
jgi:hypothetical protein